jgi:hypothetical protein
MSPVKYQVNPKFIYAAKIIISLALSKKKNAERLKSRQAKNEIFQGIDCNFHVNSASHGHF